MDHHLVSTCFVPLVLGCILASCGHPKASPAHAAPIAADPHVREIADFEAPDADALRWVPLAVPATQASTAPGEGAQPGVLSRSSLRPFAGLWSERVVIVKPAVMEGGAQPSDAATLPAEKGGDTGARSGSARFERTPAAAGGTILRDFAQPADFGAFDQLTSQILQTGQPSLNGSYLASLELVDADKKTVRGDAFPITSRWQEVGIDLHWAFDQGLDVSRIISMGVRIEPVSAAGEDLQAFDIQTDAWKAVKQERTYLPAPRSAGVGGAGAAEKKFFIEAQGHRLKVGTSDLFEMDFWDRGGAMNAAELRPSFEVSSLKPRRLLLGTPGTGLFLLDSSGMENLSASLRRTADDAGEMGQASARGREGAPAEALCSWPLKPGMPALMRSHWEVVWTSPLAAIVELKQEYGPYDRLGEPGTLLSWRFMIYQSGQVFVHVEWTRDAAGRGGAGGLGGSSENENGGPVSWGLALDERVIDHSRAASGIQAGAAGDGERLLTELYPLAIRNAVNSVLPHRMQTGDPIGLIGKTAATSDGAGLAPNPWWWARISTGGEAAREEVKVVGVGINAPAGAARAHADCMLLLNAPNALTRAAAASQYLSPPKVLVRQGELDRNFPGDAENDGFVEAYGFQVVRLAGGRAAFAIYPQGRPIFFPAYLFTIPAVERESLDLGHSRLLINVDGKQFADPPQFPDGSFLLQLPYVLDKPVEVEALLVRR
jgi:hypothetical protein